MVEVRAQRASKPDETVAVVVVTYNRGALLMRMLGGLAALDRVPDAVIVVDNASTDHTRTVLDGAVDAHPRLPLQVIRPETNLVVRRLHAEVEAAGAAQVRLGTDHLQRQVRVRVHRPVEHRRRVVGARVVDDDDGVRHPVQSGEPAQHPVSYTHLTLPTIYSV